MDQMEPEELPSQRRVVHLASEKHLRTTHLTSTPRARGLQDPGTRASADRSEPSQALPAVDEELEVDQPGGVEASGRRRRVHRPHLRSILRISKAGRSEPG
eukprot:1937533-Rhodomonas_salina.3